MDALNLGGKKADFVLTESHSGSFLNDLMSCFSGHALKKSN